MADKTEKRYNPKSGRYETAYIGADISDHDMDDSATTEKLQDTRGLGSYKPKKVDVVTDPEKMSPLARAAYETLENKKKRKGATTDDAAAALGARR